MSYEPVRILIKPRAGKGSRPQLLEVKIKGRKRTFASIERLPTERRWSGKTVPGTAGAETERLALGILGFLDIGGQLEVKVAEKNALMFRAGLGTESHEAVARWRDVLVEVVSPVLVASLIQGGLAAVARGAASARK